MQEELQLQHLPRYEKKRLVKGWHATQSLSSVHVHSSISNDESGDTTRIGFSNSMRSLFATPPGALAYESQRTGTWRSTPNSTDEFANDHDAILNQQLNEKLPKTVGQVKHAYRTRARKQEARDASNAIRKREINLEQRRGPRRRENELKTKVKCQQPVPLEPHQENTDNEECEENKETVDPPEDKSDGEIQLLDLPGHDIMTNAAYRNEVLRQIRHHLSNGGEVLLQSDCASTKENVKNTRLMLQMLCTQSLAYCVHDQNVVPDTVSEQQYSTRLALRLLPRHSRQLEQIWH